MEASGIYPDGWVEKRVSATLEQPGGDQVLSVRGLIPRINDEAFGSDIALLLDDQEIGRRAAGLGEFQLSAPVKSVAGKHRVMVVFGATQVLPANDGRAVGARLKFLGFEPANSAMRAATADIAKGAGLHLGEGWGPLESSRGENFRWVDNDATIVVTAEKSGDLAIALVVEAGPGVGGKCLLKAMASGHQVASALVEGRESIKLFVPVEGGKPNQFQLHVDGGGKKIPTDPRILNFRIFEVSLQRWRSLN